MHDSNGRTAIGKRSSMAGRASAGLAIVAALSIALTSCAGGSTAGGSTSGASGGATSAGPTSGGGASGPSAADPNAVACGQMKIGIIGPLTGPSSSFGESDKNSAVLAIEEYNKAHPDCAVDLVDFDTQGSADKAPAAAQKAVQQTDIVAILGPEFSGGVDAGMPILEQAGLPAVTSDATAAGFASRGWKFFHRTVGSDAIEAPGEAVWTVKNAGLKSVAVVNNGQSYGEGIAKVYAGVLPKVGGTVALQATINAQASDYSSTVLAIKGSGAQAVYCGCLYAEAARLLKQLREGGVDLQFITDAGAIETDFGKLAGEDNAKGAVAGETGVLRDENAATKQFFATYVKRFGADAAQTYAAEGYDAARAILMAIANGHHSRSSINDYLKTVSFDGPSGHVKFGPGGDVEAASVSMVQWSSGGWKFTASVDVPKGLVADE